MGDQLPASLTEKFAPAGRMEIEANSNKHRDCGQVGTSGESHVADGGYATRDACAPTKSLVRVFIRAKRPISQTTPAQPVIPHDYNIRFRNSAFNRRRAVGALPRRYHDHKRSGHVGPSHIHTQYSSTLRIGPRFCGGALALGGPQDFSVLFAMEKTAIPGVLPEGSPVRYLSPSQSWFSLPKAPMAWHAIW